VVYNNYALNDGGFEPNIATLGEGKIFFWDLRYLKASDTWKLSNRMADFGGKPRSSMGCGVFLGSRTLCSGSYEGFLYMWELEKLVLRIKAHSGSIFDIKINVQQKSFITCSSDGMIKIWATVPGGDFGEVCESFAISAVVVHLSMMDDSRDALGYVMLKPDESLRDVRKLVQTSRSCAVYIDKRIRQMIESNQPFLFVTDRGKNLVREKNEEFTLAKDLFSEVCVVLGQDRIDMMIDSESVTDIDLLVTKPDSIIDHCEVRMKGFERHHSEIRSIDWVHGSIIFGTTENVLYAIDSLKGRRSPEQVTDALCDSNVKSLCAHPSSPVFYTATADGILQIWDQNSKKCTQLKKFDISVRAMDISPDGQDLVIATSKGCLVLNTSNLEENHWIHYRPHRVTDIHALKFSFNGQYLAIGTSEGRIDIFDVHGRTHLSAWVSERLNMSLDAGGLEVDFSDGVLLCKLIEIVLVKFADGRSITQLGAYADAVDRPPSLNAWKGRPKSYAQKISLMEEGLYLCHQASSEALASYEVQAEQLDDPNYKPFISREIKQESKKMIIRRICIVRANKDRFFARDLVGKDKPVERSSLFAFFRFLRAMDIQMLQDQLENVQKHRELKAELSNFSTKMQADEREAAKARMLVEETTRRIKFAEQSKSIMLMQSLELDLQMQSRSLKMVEERLNEIKALTERAGKKFELLVYKMDRAKEEVFCFLGAGTGHSKPISHIDWSIDGMVVKSVSLAAGELKFWKTSGIQQLWPENCAGQDWATQNTPLGWSVKGLIHFECMDKQHYTKLDRGPIRSESSHLLSIGDRNGRVLLTTYPFPHVNVDMDLHFGDAFASEIGFKRITIEIEIELISELADLLNALEQRISIVKSTGPTTFIVRIGPPIGSDDKRPAFQLSMETLCCLEAGKMRSYKLLKHCKALRGPAISSCVGHTAPILAAVFDGNGHQLLSVGETDRTICVWRLLRPEDRNEGRRIHQGVKRCLENRGIQALNFLRLGDGKRIEKTLVNFLYEWDVAKSGIPPEKIDPVIRMVKDYKTADICTDLERRGISIVGLSERDELAARLCTAMTTPETMTIAEIRAELTQAKVSSANVFERSQLITLLLKARREGTEFPRPIPFAFQRIAPAHEVIIARAHARWAAAAGGVKKTKSLRELETDVQEILDAVYSLDLHEAGELGVKQTLIGIMALIQSNRLEIAAACARDKLYEDTSRKGMDINSISTKDPRDVDWLVGGAPPSTDLVNLKKGGYLYDSAVKSTRGDLLPGSCYAFPQIPGRYFEYVRFDERGEFVDRLHEHPAESSFATERELTRLSGLKTVRWGSRFYAKQIMNNTIKSQALPLQWKQDSQTSQSTAYLYQVPLGIPRLHARRLPSATQIEKFFVSLDEARIGLVDMDSFEEAIFKELYQSEILGLPVQSARDASIVKELVFSRGLLAGTGHSEEDMGSKSRIQQSDLFDFLLPNIDVNGHVIFKVRMARLSGEVRMGFVDVFRIPHGVSLDADWSWPGFPTWHLDSSGGLYQFGQEVCQATTKLNENDIVVADLDQNQVRTSLRLFRTLLYSDLYC
jgi:WD40 repeat protein